MKNMFFNYDNNSDKNFESHYHNLDFLENLPYVRDINGKFLGIKAKYQHPITLYFHLEDLGSEYLVSNGMSVEDLILSSKIYFEIKTTTAKTVINKLYDPSECFNAMSNDLIIYLTQAEVKKLKQESYTMSLKLVWEEDFYELFTSQDGLLIIR